MPFKHISALEVGDKVVYSGELYTVVKPPYQTKTDLGREFNVEVKGGTEDYLYASYFPNGIVEVQEAPKYELIKAVADHCGWSVSDLREIGYTVPVGETQLELGKHSPAGEDFFVTARGNSPGELVADIVEMAGNFDPEEHAGDMYEAGKNGLSGVPSLKTLVQDGDDIKEMLEDLAEAMTDALEISQLPIRLAICRDCEHCESTDRGEEVDCARRGWEDIDPDMEAFRADCGCFTYSGTDKDLCFEVTSHDAEVIGYVVVEGAESVKRDKEYVIIQMVKELLGERADGEPALRKWSHKDAEFTKWA